MERLMHTLFHSFVSRRASDGGRSLGGEVGASPAIALPNVGSTWDDPRGA